MFDRWGQLVIAVISLVVAALAFVRSNDLAALHEADARNSTAVLELKTQLNVLNEQMYLLREDSVKHRVILEQLLKQTR